MKHKKAIASVALLLLGLGGLYAQEALITTGGEVTGTGGTASYSIGQVSYTSITGVNGSLTQGIQQPYEIFTTTGINETSFNLYPNPTTNQVTLKTNDHTSLSYRLYDMLGKIIETKGVSSNSTHINLEVVSIGFYFLSVVKNNQIVKTFKIIKN